MPRNSDPEDLDPEDLDQDLKDLETEVDAALEQTRRAGHPDAQRRLEKLKARVARVRSKDSLTKEDISDLVDAIECWEQCSGDRSGDGD